MNDERGLTRKDIERLPHMSERELTQFVERVHERTQATVLQGEAMLLEQAANHVDSLVRLASALPLEGRFAIAARLRQAADQLEQGS
jgi:hypothetical protein